MNSPSNSNGVRQSSPPSDFIKHLHCNSSHLSLRITCEVCGRSLTAPIVQMGQAKSQVVTGSVQVLRWLTFLELSSAPPAPGSQTCSLSYVIPPLTAFLSLQPLRVSSQPGPQKRCLFVCRHGERMDVVFGKYWLSQCFDAKGEWLVDLLSIGIPITASRGHSQATFV